MGQYLIREWQPIYATAVLSRRQKRAGSYRPYMPDRLVGRRLSFDAGVAADVADAERDIARLDLEAKALSNTEALARLLLRAESWPHRG